jgi:hypothetical protein
MDAPLYLNKLRLCLHRSSAVVVFVIFAFVILSLAIA